MEIALPSAICNIIFIVAISILGRHFNYNFATTSTLCVFTIGIIGYCALISISNPLIVRKKVMIAISFVLFIITFIFGNKPFGLQSILTLKYAYLFVAIFLIAWPLFMFMREVLGRRVFSKINWK
jgi:hypothetical protein